MHPQKQRVVSAVTPSSSLTLGNYLGALKHWVLLQESHDCVYFIGDLHALTDRFHPTELREKTLEVAATYLACGIDPNRSTFFVQSHVPAHTQLMWLLTCLCPMGDLSRMTQFKDKSQKHGESIPTGLFQYPILMAADILLYGADAVPIGADQKQHLELTRDLAQKVNHLAKKEICKLPKPMIPEVAARVMSLQDPTKKMSKSDADPHATIYLLESEDQWVKKFKRAVTDSGTEITDSPQQAGVHNLLSIQSALTGQSIAQRVEYYRGKMYGHLKIDTAELCKEKLGPIRKRALELLSDKPELLKLMEQGAQKARSMAEITLKKIQSEFGLVGGRDT